jgi:hypothetical protein
MPSPEFVDPARLERLLAGAAPETAGEAILQGLVRELRADASAASPALHERVRALRQPESRVRTAFTWRRAAVAFAAASLAAVGAVAAFSRGSSDFAERAGQASITVAGADESAPPVEDEPGGAMRDAAKPLAAPTSKTLTGGFSTDGASAPPVDGRARDVDMFIELRVKDADALSEATNRAMAATRSLGGYVRSSNVGTQGDEGRAQLELSIPVGRLQDAVVRLSALGAITQQQVATVDLQGSIDGRSRQIARLGRAIEADKLRLASGTLTPEEKLRVELRLVRERAALARLRSERAKLLREAAMAEVTLSLHTREAGATPAKEGKIVGAVHDGVDLLAAGGAVAILVLIVASPLLVLAVLLGLGLRTRRRRIDERLLAQPRPAGAPQATPPPTSE